MFKCMLVVYSTVAGAVGVNFHHRAKRRTSGEQMFVRQLFNVPPEKEATKFQEVAAAALYGATWPRMFFEKLAEQPAKEVKLSAAQLDKMARGMANDRAAEGHGVQGVRDYLSALSEVGATKAILASKHRVIVALAPYAVSVQQWAEKWGVTPQIVVNDTCDAAIALSGVGEESSTVLRIVRGLSRKFTDDVKAYPMAELLKELQEEDEEDAAATKKGGADAQ